MTPNRESLMLPAVQAYVKQRYAQQAVEVPFYEHRIDLYGYSAERHSTVAVELKLRDWRRAVEQALVYQLCSDYVFIAVPEKTAQRIDRNELETYGIGLLVVSECRCVEAVPANLSPVLNSDYRDAYIGIMKE